MRDVDTVKMRNGENPRTPAAAKPPAEASGGNDVLDAGGFILCRQRVSPCLHANEIDGPPVGMSDRLAAHI